MQRTILVGLALVVGRAETFAQPTSPTPPECALEGLPRKGGGAREEPLLEGRVGWVFARPESDREKVGWRKKPWLVPTLMQTGPTNWSPSGPPLVHKTQARVVKQHLRHSGYGHYNGELDIETMDGKRATIDLKSFTYRPYWACPLQRGRSTNLWTSFDGPVVVTIPDDVRPVNRSGEWVALKKKESLLCESRVRDSDHGHGLVVKCSILDARGRLQQDVEVKTEDVIIVY